MPTRVRRFKSGWVLWRPCPTAEAYKLLPLKGKGNSFLSCPPNASATCTVDQSGRGPAWSGRVVGIHENASSNLAVLTRSPGRQPADHRCLNHRMLWVRLPHRAPATSGSVGNRQTSPPQTRTCCGFNSHPGHWQERPRGAARSARGPVTAEVGGSNPLEDAGHSASAGHWRAHAAVTRTHHAAAGSTPARRTHGPFGVR